MFNQVSIQLKPSYWAGLVFILPALALSIAILYTAPLHALAWLTCIILIVCTGLVIQRYGLLNSKHSIVSIALHSTHFQLRTARQKTIAAQLYAVSYCSPYLLLIHFKDDTSYKPKIRHVLIMPFNHASKQSFRRLRVMINYAHPSCANYSTG